MRDDIIKYSIELLLRDGLRFSIDDVAKALKISKKTIYKFFPTKEQLAIVIYKTYYENALCKIEELSQMQSKDAVSQMLEIYYRSHCMVREEIFNKYAINSSVCGLAKANHNRIRMVIENLPTPLDKSAVMIIIDGALQKLYENKDEEEKVIARLVTLIC